ncbi:MAG: BrnT family toxin [bacterium]|nr:BrnT family toxin [bacterium]
MKIIEWNETKNKKLKQERGISFEEVVFYIERGSVIDIVAHPNRKRYPEQKIFIIDIDDYIYLVPFVENEEVVFLKTIIPSRKATKEYLKR